MGRSWQKGKSGRATGIFTGGKGAGRIMVFRPGILFFRRTPVSGGKIRYKNCPFLLFLGPVYDIIEKMGVFILRGTYDKTDSPAHG